MSVKFDASQSVNALLKDFGKMQAKQVPYAMSRTINILLVKVQEEQRAADKASFTVRRATFISRLIKINSGDWASKTRLLGRVGYQGPKADLLAKFEDGGAKVSPSGARVWIPSAARRSKSDIITRSNRPKGLNLTPTISSVGKGATIFRGDKRTFMIKYRDGTGVVLQRFGRAKRGKARKRQLQSYMRRGVRMDRKEGTRTLFVYLRRDPVLPATLAFIRRASRVVDKSIVSTFQAEMYAALWGRS